MKSRLVHSLVLAFVCSLHLSAAPAEPLTNSLVRIQQVLADKSHPITWVLTGDSITHGAKHTAGSRSYVEHFAERVRWELGRGQDVVINTGLSGDRTEGLLRQFEARVERFKPDVVSLMLGMNDCTAGAAKREAFRHNLRQLVERTRALGAVPILHTPNSIDQTAAKERADLPAYAAIIREVALEQQIVLVDHWAEWQKVCARREMLAERLSDPIHPNGRGHRELAILMFKALGLLATNSPTCQSVPSITTYPVLELKPAGAGLEIHAKATEMPGQKMGPFVRLGDGRLLCLQGTNSWVSADEGATWQVRPLFAEPAKFKIDESTLVRTRKGVLLAAFMNMAEVHWTWDNKLGDASGATLPTYVLRSLDDGATWEPPQKLHDDWTGANRDMQELKSGRVIFTSMKLRHNPGRHSVLTYCSDDQGQTWKPSNVIDLGDAGDHGGVTEATIEELKDGRLLMLMRCNWMRFWQAESSDGGLHWHPLGPSTIPASCAPGTLQRLRSGRILLVWNRPFPEGQDTFPLTGGDRRWSATPVSNHRGELSIAFSEDECKSWGKPVVIARKPGAWLSYPFVFESAPGELWITTMQGGVRLKLREADFCGLTAEGAPSRVKTQ